MLALQIVKYQFTEIIATRKGLVLVLTTLRFIAKLGFFL